MKQEEKAFSSKRDENSLYTLTRKFIKLMVNSPDQAISITTAAQMLQVAKRRVYDITNVLESIGLITKWNINSVRWIGGSPASILNAPTSEKLIQNEHDKKIKNGVIISLDREIEELNSDLQELSNDKSILSHAYVTYNDIKSLEMLSGKLLFAMKAPDDTAIEYPKYEKGSYRMKISVEKGYISVFYIDNER
ncbi:hypothetical protein NUSPORA_00313 [Nucleospora cyclopteri]